MPVHISYHTSLTQIKYSFGVSVFSIYVNTQKYTMDKLRNSMHLLADLDGGDRFYFKGDKKKKVYTLNNVHPFEYKMQVGFKIQYANCRDEVFKEGSPLQVIQFRANRYVIFLRNINAPLK